MHLAHDALSRNAASVAVLAERLGYSSESAFGGAYKRTFGRSPKSQRPAAQPRPGPLAAACASTPEPQ
jgi:AraC-like DNA-binding protein